MSNNLGLSIAGVVLFAAGIGIGLIAHPLLFPDPEPTSEPVPLPAQVSETVEESVDPLLAALREGRYQEFAPACQDPAQRLVCDEFATEKLEAGEPVEVVLLCDAVLAIAPRSSWALSWAAEAAVRQDRPLQAIEYLAQILDYPDELEVQTVIEARLFEVLEQMSDALRLQGSFEELADYYAALSERLPVYDQLRLGHARALFDMDLLAESREMLDTVGLYGVDAAELEMLVAAVEAAIADAAPNKDVEEGEGDPFHVTHTRRGMIAHVTAGGSSLDLLVDTGATITGINATALRTLRATDTNRSVQLATANGVVEGRLFEIEALWIGRREFRDLVVVELPVDLGQSDGVLGMDILERTGLPEPVMKESTEG